MELTLHVSSCIAMNEGDSTVSQHQHDIDSEEQKDLMRNDPEYYLRYRKDVETEMVSGFKFYHRYISPMVYHVP